MQDSEQEVSTPRQAQLRRDQLDAFDFDGFVKYQVSDLNRFMTENGVTVPPDRYVVDVGGGRGYFAQAISGRHGKVKVYETDDEAIKACRTKGIEAHHVDATSPALMGNEHVACLNLILHHLIGSTEAETLRLQTAALTAWKGHCIFVHEYCYQGIWLDRLPGQLIYLITSSTWLSSLARVVAARIPSLRANTFGIGVRFRSSSEWLAIFRNCGLQVAGVAKGEPERISPARRLLMIKSIRRDSFFITPS